MEWFDVRARIEKAIVGALQSTIDAHGPITKENCSSAAKRIYGALKGERKQMCGPDKDKVP